MKFDNLLHKLRTPIETINILGCGGLRMGTMSECWGTPSGGKSTFCYQTGSYFQKDYPEGILHLLDVENSYDDIRMEKVFGIDIHSENFKVEHAPTIEAATEKIVALMKIAQEKSVPYLCILDSWTALNTESTIENIEDTIKSSGKEELNMHAGSMMQKPKATRHWLNAIMSYMYNSPMTMLIINQASTSMNRFGATVGSGGGYGLKHDIQYSLCFTKKDDTQDGDIKLGFMNTSLAQSEVEVTKSKFIPDFAGIPMFINVAGGGIILPRKELIALGKAKGIIATMPSGWYVLEGTEKKVRLADLEDIEGIDELIRTKMTDKFRKDFFLVNMYYEERERRLNAVAG